MTLPVPIQKAIDFGQEAYNSPIAQLMLNAYSIYGIYKILPTWKISNLHKAVIVSAITGKAASLIIAANSKPEFQKIDGLQNYHYPQPKLNGLQMNTKVIGYSVLGVATLGLVGTGIYMWIQHNKDKEAQKKLAEETGKKLENQSYSQNNQLPPQVIAPAPLPVQHSQTNTPKPTPKPAPAPAQAEKDSTFYWGATLKSSGKPYTYFLEIEWLQRYLNTKGYSLTVDGVFGPGTRAAMYKAMGLPNADSLTITLDEFCAKAEAAFRAPMLLSQKISRADFINFINPPAAAQNVNMNTTWGSGMFPNTVNGFGSLSSVGI